MDPNSGEGLRLPKSLGLSVTVDSVALLCRSTVASSMRQTRISISKPKCLSRDICLVRLSPTIMRRWWRRGPRLCGERELRFSELE